MNSEFIVGDIEDMGAFIAGAGQINTHNNYSYDAEGRLVKDKQEEIDTIIWTVSGKVKEIRRTLESSKKNLTFEYDAFGNRIAKHVYDNQTLMLEKSTYYILDAQGNQLSMYEHLVDDAEVNYYLTERNIYGSSRLGTVKDPVNMFDAKPLQSYGILGNRNYELSNHLGNVLTVISDIIYPLSSDNTSIDSYEVGISNVFDYSPFGAPLDGRTIDKLFYKEEITTDTITENAFALEETFNTSSDWTVINAGQITYPSGKMSVKNTGTIKQKIGAKKSFTTGEGLHEVSFEIKRIPDLICGFIVLPPFGTMAVEGINTTNAIGPKSTLNVVVKNQNNFIVTSGSYTTTGVFSNLSFTAAEGNNYTIEFYIDNICANAYFEVDDVFVSYGKEVVVENKEYVVSGGYRYGFNGMEKDDNVKGAGNSYTTEFRQYDPRVGRWLSLDPKEKEKVGWTPYNSMSNNPVIFIDPLGDTDYYNRRGKYVGTDGVDNGKNQMILNIANAKMVKRETKKGNNISFNKNVYTDVINIPDRKVIDAMTEARKASNRPAGDDKWGGYHEEGFIYGKKDGKTYIIKGDPGPLSSPDISDVSYGGVFDPKPAILKAMEMGLEIEADVHIHPKGRSNGWRFKQSPSEPDISGQKAYEEILNIKHSIVIGASNKKVSFFNSKGTVGDTRERFLRRANRKIDRIENKKGSND